MSTYKDSRFGYNLCVLPKVLIDISHWSRIYDKIRKVQILQNFPNILFYVRFPGTKSKDL